MKKMLSILVSLMVLIHICSGTALAAETGSTDIAVDYTIGETELQVDISDIPVVNARQMLSILLVHKDADANNMSTSEVVYSNAIYLNGRDNVAFDIDIDGIDIEDYRLVIRDSHDSVNYSHLFETESGGDGTGGTEPGGDGAGGTEPGGDGTGGTEPGGDGTGGTEPGGSGTGGTEPGGSGAGGTEPGGDGTDGTESGGDGAGETKPSGSATEETKGNASEKDTNKPSTGDDSRAAFLFGMVLISGMVVVAVYNRRHEREVSKNED